MMYDLQKASIWKRASAFLFDVILLSVAAVGFAFIISAVTGYDGYTKELDGIYAAAEEKYGVKLSTVLSTKRKEKATMPRQRN